MRIFASKYCVSINTMKRFKTLGSRIAVRTSLYMIFSLLLTTGSALFVYIHQANARVEEKAAFEIRLLDNKIREMMNHVEVVSKSTTHRVEHELADPQCKEAELEEILTEVDRTSDVISHIGVLLDRESSRRHHIDIDAPFEYSENTIAVPGYELITPENRMEWYNKIRLNNVGIWSKDSIRGDSYIVSTYSQYLRAEGDPVGTIVSMISPAQILHMLDETQITPNIRNGLLRIDGKLILNNDSSILDYDELFADARFKGFANKEQLFDTMMSNLSGVIEGKVDGKRGWLCYTALPSNSWKVISFIPIGDMFSSATLWGFAVIVIVMLLFILIMVLILRHTVHHMLKPLRKVVTATRKVSEGNFNFPLPHLYKGDEIQELNDSFIKMQESLYATIQQERSMASEIGRMESELQVARQIQMSMVTPVDEAEQGFFALMEPAREVGGDLYHIHQVDDRLFFAIGDVSGKGVPAAIIMAQIESLLMSAEHTELTTGNHMMNTLNRMVCSNNSINMFATLLMGCLNTKTGDLYINNAGHVTPILTSPDGTTAKLQVETNLPLGLKPDMNFVENHFMLQPGSMLFLCSDGVIETENRSNEPYGMERLLATLKNRQGLTPQEVVRVVRASTETFADGQAQPDDTTILVIRFDPQA